MDDEKTVFQPRPAGGARAGIRLNGVYEIERLLAQGGMGEVYKGFNIQTHDPVAIKMIRAEMSGNPEVLALFRREASTLFNLNHEGIVRYFVFSVDPTLERAYLAMEFVDGPSLAKRVAERPLDAEEARILVSRIGSALDAAHRLGVVHRDISSDNVILPDGDVRKAKLIDFGIARSHRPGEATIIGDGFAGKYNYVSPEQLGLAGGEVTAKSDIYSFGLVLAEALRGRPIDMSGTQVDIIEKRRRTPDLSSVPVEFRPLLQSLLQPNPADRPGSMSAVIAMLAAPPKPTRSKRSGGSAALWAAAALIAVSLGALGFAFRDDLGALIPKSSPPSAASKPTPATNPDKPPPLPPAEPTPAPTPALPPEPTPSPIETTTPPPSPGATNTSVPGLDALRDAAPPRARQETISLRPATVGVAYRAELPAFIDPGEQGLKLSAEGAPDGLSFADHGDGSGELTGTPTHAGDATLTVVAVNRHGHKARMTATITVGAPPPPSPIRTPAAPQASVTLSSAVAGRDYNAPLPPFSPGSDARGLVLRAEPPPPEGLTFADAGGGYSLVSGRPTRAGDYNFEVIASDANGQGGRMTVKLTVKPAPDDTSARTEKLQQFLRGYDGGACFYASLAPSSGSAASIDAVAADRQAFARLDAAVKREMGSDVAIAAHVATSAQCSAVDLLKSSRGAAPTLRLDNIKVGAGRPLSGRVLGLAGRRLALVSIDNDGDAFQLSSPVDADGAEFNEPLSGDAGSIDKTQILLAIASDGPLSAVVSVKRVGEKNPVNVLRSDLAAAGVAVGVGYYELTQ